MNTTTKKNRNIFEVLWTNNRFGVIATIIILSVLSIYFMAAMILPKVYPETNWDVYNIALALIIGTLHVMLILYIIFFLALGILEGATAIILAYRLQYLPLTKEELRNSRINTLKDYYTYIDNMVNIHGYKKTLSRRYKEKIIDAARCISHNEDFGCFRINIYSL